MASRLQRLLKNGINSLEEVDEFIPKHLQYIAEYAAAEGNMNILEEAQHISDELNWYEILYEAVVNDQFEVIERYLFILSREQVISLMEEAVDINHDLVDIMADIEFQGDWKKIERLAGNMDMDKILDYSLEKQGVDLSPEGNPYQNYL